MKYLFFLYSFFTFSTIVFAQSTTTGEAYNIICCSYKDLNDTTGVTIVMDSSIVVDLDGDHEGSIYFTQKVRLIESSLIGNSLYIKEKGKRRIKVEFASKMEKRNFIKEAKRKKYVKIRNYKIIEYPIYVINFGLIGFVIFSIFIN
ncbi:MAG: hypothetical protein SFY32_09545 [Bacteroidota bacterium]|nr:hypothetical protein [Bacteroidota bacterium]